MGDALSAEDVIRQHDLKPHPEEGWFRETFRDATGPHGRAHSNDPVPVEDGRGFALAQGRCGRALALVWRGAAPARSEARRGAA
jgi:hypothetical protein